MVVTQWAERLLPTPEVCGSNPVVLNKIVCPSTITIAFIQLPNPSAYHFNSDSE